MKPNVTRDLSIYPLEYKSRSLDGKVRSIYIYIVVAAVLYSKSPFQQRMTLISCLMKRHNLVLFSVIHN